MNPNNKNKILMVRYLGNCVKKMCCVVWNFSQTNQATV